MKMIRGKKIWISLLVLIVLGGAGSYFGAKILLNRRAEGWKRDGIAASRAGQHEQAAFLLGGYLRRHIADSRDAGYMEALKCYVTSCELEESGRHLGEAVAALKLLVGQEPDRIEHRQHLLELFVKMGRAPEALDTGKFILAFLHNKKLPSDARTLELMTDVLMTLHQYSEALSMARDWIVVAPADLHANMALISLMAGSGQSSESVLKTVADLRAVITDDSSFELLQGFAYSMFREDPATGVENVKSAAMWLRKAAAHPGPKDDFINLLVSQLDRLGLPIDSLAFLQGTVKNGAGRDIRHALARRLWQLNQWEPLAAVLGDLDIRDPKSSSTMIAFKCMALLNTAKATEAAACRAELARRKEKTGDKPKDAVAGAWDMILSRGADSAKINGPQADKQLMAECEAALAVEPTNAYLRYFLAEADSRLGHRNQAIQNFQNAAAGASTWSLPARRLVESLLDEGRNDQAFGIARYALQRDPTNASLVIGMARAWSANIEAGDAAQSAELLKLVNSIQEQLPGEERTFLIRLKLLAAQSDKTAAIKSAREMLAHAPPPDERIFLSIAGLSRQYNLALEDDCFAATEKANGITARLAHARALYQFTKSGVDAGLKVFDDLAARSKHATDVLWQLARCEYLDAANHPDARAAWIILGKAFPDDLAVQQSALAANAVQADPAFMQESIDRLKALTEPPPSTPDKKPKGDKPLPEPDTGHAWQLAQAKLWIASSKPKENTDGITLLKNISKAQPDLVEPHLLLARELVRGNQIEAAIQQLTQAKQCDPSSVPVSLLLAGLLQSHNDFDRVRQELDRIMPRLRSPDQRRAVAVLLAKQGSLDQPIGLLEQAKDEPGTDGPGRLLLAILYGRRGEFAKAEAIVTKLLDQNPDLSVIQFAASFYASTGRRAEAEKVLARLDSLKLEPGVKDLVLGSYCAQNGDLAEAVKHYGAVTKLIPANTVAWRTMATVQMALGRYPDAETTIQNALIAIPDDKPLKSIAEHFNLLRDAAADPELRPVALTYMRDPLTGDKSLELLNAMTEAFRSKNMQQLIATLRQMAEQNPTSVAIQLQLIRSLGTLNRTTDALATAKRTMNAFPEDPEPARLATNICEKAQRFDEMLSAARTWKKRAGFNTIPADVAIASALIKTGLPDEAVNALQPHLAIASADPNRNANVLIVHSIALADSGHAKEANDLLWPLAQKSGAWRFAWVQVCIDFKNSDTSIAWLNQIAPIIPADAIEERVALAEGYDHLGIRFNQPELIQKSTTLFAAIAASPKVTPIALLSAGSQAERAKALDTAEAYYLHAIVLDGNLWIAKNNLAMLIVQRGGDLKQAAIYAEEASRLHPRSGEVLDTVAAVLAKQGRPKDAANAIDGAVHLDPDNLKWHIGLAGYLLADGDFAKANKELATIDTGHFDLNTISPDQRTQLEMIRLKLKKTR